MYDKTKFAPKTNKIDEAQHEHDVNVLVELSEDHDDRDLIDKIDMECLLASTIPEKLVVIPKIQSFLKKKSNKFPALGTNMNLNAFLTMASRDINRLNFGPNSLPNLTDKEKFALEKQIHLTIKQADKGGNIVIMSNLQYKEMGLKILNNSEWYIKISKSQINQFDEEF